MVSLKVPDNNPLTASEIWVDTIKLAERFNTGLPGGKEGDHTIADVVNKKYQKLMVRNRPVNEALDFYKSHSELLIKENDMFFSARGVNQDIMSQQVQGLHEDALKETAEAFGVEPRDAVEFVTQLEARSDVMQQELEKTAEQIMNGDEASTETFSPMNDSQALEQASKSLKKTPIKKRKRKQTRPTHTRTRKNCDYSERILLNGVTNQTSLLKAP